MRPREIKHAARAARVTGLLAALLGAVAGFLVGRVAGVGLLRGFTVDWYREPAKAFVTLDEFALYAGVVAVSIALLFGPLGIAAAMTAWDRRAQGRSPPNRTGARVNRDSFLLAASVVLVVLVPLVIALLGVGLLHVLGSRGIEGDALPVLLSITGAMTGFFAAYLGSAQAARGLAAGRLVKTAPGDNLIGTVAVACARHNKATLAIVLLLAGGMAGGLVHIDTNVDVADVLPRGDPNTAAAKNVTEHFKSTFTQQVTFMFRVDEAKWAVDNERLPYRVTEPTPSNISDELYVRALAEAVDFIRNEPPFAGAVGLSEFYNLINWTIAGGIRGEASSFAMPGTDLDGSIRFASLERGVWVGIPGTAEAVVSPSYRQTSMLINVDPQEEMGSKEIGRRALEVRDAYVKWAESTPSAYKVFTGDNAPIFSVDLPIANAHSSELAKNDFITLMPAIAVFILVALFVGYRSAGAITVAFSALSLAVVITFGAMGYMRMPLNTLNLTTVALIMGIGIDYGIHVINEYLEGRSKGLTQDEAMRNTGGHTVFALLVATLTTVSGLLILYVSPSILIAQLGLLSIIAMISCFALSVTFIPAGLAFMKSSRDGTVAYKPSHLMAGLAGAVGRNRVAVLLILLALAGSAYYSASRIETEEFGDPPRNWLPDDPMREEHERAIRGFYDSPTDDIKANILIFEGDVTDPAAHLYMRAIECSLTKKSLVISDTLRTLPFLIDTYLTVRDGAVSVPYAVTQRSAPICSNAHPPGYPQTTAEMDDLIDEVFTTPLYQFGNLFIDNPRNEIAIMLFSAKAASFEDAEAVWLQVHEAIEENAHLKPEGVQVHMFGNTAINYLFVAKQVPWLMYMAVATNVIVVLLVLLLVQDLKAALVVGAANFVTGLLWLGILPLLDIGLAITLALPLTFIFAMGSDYALHLALRCRHSPTAHVFRTTGKAVLMSFVTTTGAFAIFVQISNLAVRKTMIATTVAIAVIFIVTLLVIPLAYPDKESRRKGRVVPVRERVPHEEPAVPEVR